MARFTHFQQRDQMSCGATCLRMVARHFGKSISQHRLEELTHLGKTGVSLLAICDAAESLGLRTLPVRCSFGDLIKERRVPFIAHWSQNHFVVVFKIAKDRVHVADPAAASLLSYSYEEFERFWISSTQGGSAVGVATFFETTPLFKAADEDDPGPSASWPLVKSYLAEHRRAIVQLGTAVFAALLVSLLLPFLAQAQIDQGVGGRDLNLISLILLAQLACSLGGGVIGFLRGQLTLYVSTRISVALVADFLQTVMALPMSYFDRKTVGDLLQRLDDNKRIERFLTSGSLDVAASLFIVLGYALVVALLSFPLFATMAFGIGLYIFWIRAFLSARRRIDGKRFNELANARSNEVQLIRGIPEIKLTTCEKERRWEWERVQVKLFKITLAGHRLELVQNTGGTLLLSITVLACSYMAANAVVAGHLTIGTMVAVSMMLGQIQGPLTQLVQVLQDGQDALISFERISEIRALAPEDPVGTQWANPPNGTIELRGVKFRYGDPNSPLALDGLNMLIEEGTTNAIVGSSGCGKTTLLKLLLKFYAPESGSVLVGGTSLERCEASAWRARCGVVMQDGFIFHDSIARNIALTDDIIDRERLVWAARVANAMEFVERMPLGFNTKIGDDGVGLSGGQRQRILIARALYKRPDFLLLDEATSALDAESEAMVSRNFDRETSGITKVIIAHRLNTVKNADKIFVLEKGRIVESGSHDELTIEKGFYYRLIKDQLQLGG